MADDQYVQKFGFDVVGAEDLKNKLNKNLKEYGKTLDDVYKVTARFNKANKATKVTVTGLDEENKRFTTSLKAQGAVWRTLYTDVNKTVKSLTAAQQKFKDLENLEKAAVRRRTAGTVGLLKGADLTGFNEENRKNLGSALAGKSNADQARLIAAHQRFVQIQNSEVNILKLRQKVEAQQAKEAAANFRKIKAFETEALARKKFLQAVENREALERFKSIRQFERQAAAQRRSSEEARKLALQMSRTGKAGKQAAQEVLISWLSVQRLFLVQVLHQAVAQLRISLEQAARTALDYSKRISEIRTISQEANESTEVWNQALLKQSDVFGIDLLDVTRAEYEALSNQIVNSSKEMGFLTEASKLALITNSDLETSVDAVSSVLNSFKLSSSESARVAAVLFRTIDLGKTTMAELANNLGRTNALSRTLGVSFEEQQAALSTLTIQGLEDHTAKTLLNAIYQKLIRPTKHMKELLAEWGVTTAEAANRTFGFGEVLSRVIALAEKSGSFAEELGEGFQELRSITGVATLDLDVFKQHLQENLSASGKYVNAFAIVNESEGRKIQVQLNKLKNLFIGFGQTINKTFLDVTANFGGADQIVIKLINTFKNLIITYGILKGATIANNLVTTIANAKFTTMNFIMLALQGRIAVTTALFGALRANLAAIGVAGVFALVTLVNSQKSWQEKVEESIAKVQEQFDKLNQVQLQQGIDKFKEWEKSFDQSSSSVFKRLSELNIAFTQRVNAMAVDLKALNKTFTASIKELFDGQNKGFKENIKNLQKIITESDKAIKNIKEKLVDDNELNELKLEFKLDLNKNDLGAQIQILRDELDAAAQDIRIAVFRGASFEELQDKFERLNDVAKKFYKTVLETNDPDRISAAQRLVLDLINRQNTELLRQKGILEQRKADAERELAQQKAAQEIFQKNFDKLKNLKKDTTLQDFDVIASQLDKAGQAANLTVQEQLQLFQLLQEQRKNFLQNDIVTQSQKTLAELRAQAEAAQKIAEQSKEAVEKSVNDLHTNLTASQKEFINILGSLKGQVDDLFPAGTTVNQTGLSNLNSIFQQLDTSLKQIGVLQSKNDFAGIAKEIEKINSKTRELIAAFDTLSRSEFVAPGPTPTAFGDLLAVFDKIKLQVRDFNNLSLNNANIEKQFKAIEDQLKSLSGVKVYTDEAWVRSQTDVNNSFRELSNLLQNNINKYLQLQRLLGTPNGTKPGGQQKYNGGRIGYYYSGGRGTDTQMAYLTPGEYVFDRDTTRKAYPMIRSIHQASKYIGSQGATNSTFNVGGITINGNNGNAQELSNLIVRTIQRAVRRGQLSL